MCNKGNAASIWVEGENMAWVDGMEYCHRTALAAIQDSMMSAVAAAIMALETSLKKNQGNIESCGLVLS